MKNRSRNFFVALALLALSTLNFVFSNAHAQGTAFTYQGQLQNNGSLASGTYNLQFTLYTNATAGSAVAGPVTTNGVFITNGLFTVTIDFGGSVWNGATNWLQTAVESNSATSFTSLSPRQPVTPTPYAIYSEGGNAAGLSGTIPMSSLSGTYGGAISLTNGGNSFTGNGSGLTNVNAVTLGGLPAGNFWQVGGNSGVPSGSNYIGNNDNQYLDIRANGVRVFRLRLMTDGLGIFTNAPNVIGGSSLNLTAPNVAGAVIGGGGGNGSGSAYGNEVEADFGAIGGGLGNTNAGIASFIGGGGYDGTFFGGNTIYANAATIGGGLENVISGNGIYGSIGGGEANVVSNNTGTVSGGADNVAGGPYAAVGGGEFNVAGGQSATVAGGGAVVEITGGQFPIFFFLGNTASGSYAAVGGGADNAAGGAGSFIGGGGYDGNNYEGNYVQGNAAAIVGGLSNNIPSGGAYCFIGGGSSNLANGPYNTVAGGWNNQSKGSFATIVGGVGNIASGLGSFVGGGGFDTVNTAPNVASGGGSVVCGGVANTNTSQDSVICGGYGNYITGVGSVIGGGGFDGSTYGGNIINANAATIAGGWFNYIPSGSRYAAVGGGAENEAAEFYATVAGGFSGFASGEYSTVPGGYANWAQGTYSFAAGKLAYAENDGSFVWADDTGTMNFGDTAANQFVARATGGFYFWTGTSGGLEIGAKLASNATSWTTLCDRNAKKNFQPVDTVAVLDKLAAVPIEQWNYKWEKDTDTPNIGPMAQDFIAAFYPGRDNKGITTLQFDGVELAAIQGLNKKLNEKDVEIQRQSTEIADLQSRLDALEQIILKQRSNSN